MEGGFHPKIKRHHRGGDDASKKKVEIAKKRVTFYKDRI